MEALEEQIQRTPVPFPSLKIAKKESNIDHYTIEHFEIVNYRPNLGIKMDMVA